MIEVPESKFFHTNPRFGAPIQEDQMAKLIAGTVTGLRGSHKRYRRFMDFDSSAEYAFVAKTSLWALVTEPSGHIHKAWIGKIRGRSGIPIKRQEQELADKASFLLGQHVVIVQKRNGFIELFGIKGPDYSTIDSFIAELQSRVSARSQALSDGT